ncbi:DNA internalization-related competence protein ComEC/Rec2 [Halomonas rhizosphaerae]|uniref:DNA internalization-related competence protein ComEC/Rec2 n=1 Tax=Halomonas rhizosphaerae TaxID=3043296 RepID=A0ABT6UXU9_9GAMM|nr:DNA internalization-related competence protein ComEC/Rec2 [Halomonas rhizosphaerae]MDI5889804.1 DNA internalization-related competence protein ComEC/Rec2 [Halomonas rhizosphaerae]
MQLGLAIPLALAVLAGVLGSHLAVPGAIEVLALGLLVVLAGRHVRLAMALVVAALVAVQLLMVRGGELAPGLTRQDLRLEGRLVSVARDERLARLTLEVTECRPLAETLPDCRGLARVRLSFFDAPAMVPGEHWRLTVRLRPPAGFANPGTFDYRGWLWREGIQANGYVRRDPPPRRLATAPFSLRRLALGHLDEQQLAARHRRWLAALTLGVSERLGPEDWDLLNATGTTHLMVISGLHVGLVAAFALWLARGVARLVTPGAWRLTVWPWWMAGTAAVGYAGLAGLEPPALRAMLMTLVGLWVASGRHSPGPWQAWWLALALVLLADPLSAWRPGLWLSFVAVALLILVWQGRARPRGVSGWLRALVRSQLLLAPLMAAAVLLAFDRLAPAAPLVNLVAVPLVSSLLVPLGLLGWLTAWLPPLSALCWALFGLLVDGLVFLLDQAARWLPLWLPEPSRVVPLGLALGLAALLWALPGLIPRLRLVGTALLLLVPLGLSSSSPVTAEGLLRVRVHDVGQGQLVELRTAGYRALYDTGPRFGSGFMPLATLWPPGQRFDDVLISHADQDHVGGLPALREQHRVARFLAPPGEALEVPAESCTAGREWRRDGVTFRILWPPAESGELSSNDRSCVLLASAGEHHLLITGDVGRDAERRFLAELPPGVTLQVAGHHGSATSSGMLLVRRLAPRHVVFSAARDNPFGHPTGRVVRRFREAGSCLWSTARDGAVTFWLGEAARRGVRSERPAAWRHGGVGAGCLALESPH